MDAAAVVKQLDGIASNSFASPEDRHKVLDAVSALHARLETTYDTVIRWSYIELQRDNAIKIAVDTKLFHYLASENKSPKTTAAVAKSTVPPIPEELAERVLRQLAASRVVLERGPGLWQSNELSSALTDPGHESAIIGLYQTFRGTMHLPDLLRDKMDPPYTIPTDVANCAWALGNNRPGESLFESFANTPKLGADFANMMNFYASNRVRSWDIYPVAQRLVAGAEQRGSAPFMVDLGGSTGHDLKALDAAFPAARSFGPLVDLDRSDLIDAQGAQLTAAGITGVAHDFFNPHPASVRGARAYFLRQIIHDWTDDLSRVIIGHIRDSMTVGYSRLLIHDVVLPETGADELACALDLIMMCNVAAKERTEPAFRKLVESVDGLKVENVYRGTAASGEGIVEVVRVA